MVHKIGKNLNKKEFMNLLNVSLKEDKKNPAYERSFFYILNATRRGGFIIKNKGDIFVFAKDYDKPKSFSLIFFSNPDAIKVENLRKIIEYLPKKEIFIHHLFESKAKQIASAFAGQIITSSINKKINSYPDEDTFPQVVFPIYDLPKFKNSSFLKNSFLYDILAKKDDSGYKEDILEYLNSTKRVLNEPEIFTILIEAGMPNQINPLLNHIISSVITNWKNQQANNSKSFDEHHISPILSLVKLLRNKSLIKQSGSKIIFRAAFDLKLNKGGFWIGEFIPKKSLLIPHVIITDYYYREQYNFLLYDLLHYSYLKNIDYVNLGGSEDEELFKTKSSPKIFFRAKDIKRKLYSVYINNKN